MASSRILALVAAGVLLAVPAMADAYSPLASNRELARRLFTPLVADRLVARIDAGGGRISEHAVHPASERFLLWRPDGVAPTRGFGLVVFIPAQDEVELPPGWRSVLRRHRMAFVAAWDSGNRHSVSGRRMPLALHAHEHALWRLPIDPERVFIAGYSGGSRTAAWAAMAFPDVFKGAVLNAGSDPFGTAQTPIPPSDLFRRFQRESRIVMVMGSDDSGERLARDRAYRESARRFCVGGVLERGMPRVGHRMMDDHALGRALAALEGPYAGKADADCEQALGAQVRAALDGVHAQAERGDVAGARLALVALDNTFGGLAAPGSIELARRLAPPASVPTAGPAAPGGGP